MNNINKYNYIISLYNILKQVEYKEKENNIKHNVNP